MPANTGRGSNLLIFVGLFNSYFWHIIGIYGRWRARVSATIARRRRWLAAGDDAKHIPVSWDNARVNHGQSSSPSEVRITRIQTASINFTIERRGYLPPGRVA